MSQPARLEHFREFSRALAGRYVELEQVYRSPQSRNAEAGSLEDIGPVLLSLPCFCLALQMVGLMDGRADPVGIVP